VVVTPSVRVPPETGGPETELGSVMQAGRWKSNRMRLRYGEQVRTSRGEIARAAAVQGRNAYFED